MRNEQAFQSEIAAARSLMIDLGLVAPDDIATENCYLGRYFTTDAARLPRISKIRLRVTLHYVRRPGRIVGGDLPRRTTRGLIILLREVRDGEARARSLSFPGSFAAVDPLGSTRARHGSCGYFSI